MYIVRFMVYEIVHLSYYPAMALFRCPVLYYCILHAVVSSTVYSKLMPPRPPHPISWYCI